MPDKNYSKVIYNGNVLIDLTADSVAANKLLSGYTAHGADGAAITGNCTYDADTSDGTATAAEILLTKTAYVNGVKLTGTMPNNGAVMGTISTVAEQYTIPSGYHDGSGKVSISAIEQAKIIASNIKQGVVILGVTGTVEPSSEVTAQAKTATPTASQQIIIPDADYDYLSQVTINAVPYTETLNASGGYTVTIL